MHETIDHEISRHPTTGTSPVGPTLGIAGGGQLARMTAMSALQLGCHVVVLERNRHSPAAGLASHELIGDWNDPADLRRLAASCEVLTFENEFVDADTVAALERDGVTVRPGAACLRRVQDKLLQKRALAAAGIPVPPFKAVSTPEEVLDAAREFGWPLVLKRRRDGYDGRGNRTLRRAEDVAPAWTDLGGETPDSLYVEAFCHFSAELATIVVCPAAGGEPVVYPVAETRQRDHICHSVCVPARVPEEVARRAARLARLAALSVGMTGSMGVEMFLAADGRVLLNELAPRVHNSGHYTIEACACSQFENHVRAVLGWPLGAPTLRAPAAAMVNLLGAGKAPGRPVGIENALAVPGVSIHHYGKAMSNRSRKMGHVTALGETPEQALDLARRAAAAVTFGLPQPVAAGS